MAMAKSLGLKNCSAARAMWSLVPTTPAIAALSNARRDVCRILLSSQEESNLGRCARGRACRFRLAHWVLHGRPPRWHRIGFVQLRARARTDMAIAKRDVAFQPAVPAVDERLHVHHAERT